MSGLISKHSVSFEKRPVLREILNFCVAVYPSPELTQDHQWRLQAMRTLEPIQERDGWTWGHEKTRRGNGTYMVFLTPRIQARTISSKYQLLTECFTILLWFFLNSSPLLALDWEQANLSLDLRANANFSKRTDRATTLSDVNTVEPLSYHLILLYQTRTFLNTIFEIERFQEQRLLGKWLVMKTRGTNGSHANKRLKYVRNSV